MGFKDELLKRGPQLAMLLLAAKQGGQPAMSAFMDGLAARQREEELRARQGQQDARADELHSAQIANMNADNDRLAQQQEMEQFQRAYQLMQQASQQQAETATDPIQAENALKQQSASIASGMGMAPDKLTPFVPSMAPIISGKQKKQAQAIYEQAEKRFGPEAMANDSLTIQTPFGDKKPSELRAMFEAPAMDATGAPARPKLPPAPTQVLDLGGKKVVVDPTKLTPGQEFRDAPPATSGASDRQRFWVYRDGKPVRITEAEYQPGDQPAGTREQGRPVISGDANRIIDIDTGLNDLKTLRSTLTETAGATGTSARIGAALPNPITELTGWGMDAKKRQGTIDLVKQIIGKALEGGVLRKEDEYKYAKILPTIKDPQPVAVSKLNGLEKELLAKRGIMLEGLSDAGFDTSKFTDAPTMPAPSAPVTVGKFKVRVK